MQHFGKFLEVLNTKKNKTLNMCMIYSYVYERVISYKCNHLYWGCNKTSRSAFDSFVRSIFCCLTISEVSIAIASSSNLTSLLAVADLDGGSTYGQEKDLCF